VKANYKSDDARSKYEYISMRLYKEGLSTKDPLYIQIYNFIKGLGGSIKYSDYVSSDLFTRGLIGGLQSFLNISIDDRYTQAYNI